MTVDLFQLFEESLSWQQLISTVMLINGMNASKRWLEMLTNGLYSYMHPIGLTHSTYSPQLLPISECP